MPTVGDSFARGLATTDVLKGNIIIPAHNEEFVIGRCLDALSPVRFGAGVRVIVACNGCTDQTAAIARDRGVMVLEVSEASKTAAIRAAESECGTAPRVYLDADVELPHTTAHSLLGKLSGECLAARPAIDYATRDCRWSVRRYYRARRAIPSVMNRLWGAGVFGLSPRGRARFGPFPDITAEDYWVDLHFLGNEICILSDCPPVRIHPPRRASDLRGVLRRTYGGPSDLRGETGATPTSGKTGRELLAYARRGPGPLLDSAVYAVYALGARVGTRREPGVWERDESSRSAR